MRSFGGKQRRIYFTATRANDMACGNKINYKETNMKTKSMRQCLRKEQINMQTELGYMLC